MRITKVEHYRINTGGNSTQTVTEAELIALVLWLVMAYHVEDVAPLTLRGMLFCARDGHVIKFHDQDEAMSMDSLIELLKDIETMARLGGGLSGPQAMYPLFNEWWNCNPARELRVIKIGEVLNYFDRHDEAVFPIALRYSEWGSWYAVKATNEIEGTEIFTRRYEFENLSPNQL